MPTQSPLNAPQLSGESAAKTIAPAKASQPSKVETDPRLDPRIKKFFAAMPAPAEKPNVSSREELLAQENSPAALAAPAKQTAGAVCDAADLRKTEMCAIRLPIRRIETRGFRGPSGTMTENSFETFETRPETGRDLFIWILYNSLKSPDSDE
jgi:hypothetical protein